MPNYTPNLNLAKPLGGEAYDISIPNGNMDIIDSAIKNLQDIGTIATQNQAIAGTSNNTLMTPLRTNQAITYNANVHFSSLSGTANAKTATPNPEIPINASGRVLNFKNITANTGNVTITLPIGGTNVTIPLYNNDGTQIAPGQLKANSFYSAIMDGTNFFLIKGGGGIQSIVKRVQRGVNTLNNGVNTINVTVSSVNINKSILKLYISPAASNSNATQSLVQGSITGATNLNFTRSQGVSNVIFSWELIEFEDDVKVQRGTTTVSSQSQSIPINSVDLSKSFVIFSHSTSADSSFGSLRTMNLIASNFLNTSKQGADSDDFLSWFVVELP